MPPHGWYYRLSRFFKERFGEKVYKIPLHAGLSCPNRDGTVSTGGCIYCYNPGFSPATAPAGANEASPASIREQIIRFQARAEKKDGAPKKGSESQEKGPEETAFQPARRYLAYFQTYSNTYGELSRLQTLYEEALHTPGIIGLSVATRPDCLFPEVLELLQAYARSHHIWLELGLQSAHDRTLELINRGHTYARFVEAVLKSKDRGILVCAHIINGLPGESRKEMLQTAARINSLPVNGIKFHQLQVIRETPLEDLFMSGGVKPLNEKEYLHIVCDQLEIMCSNIVVHRLMSEVTCPGLLAAPLWPVSRAQFTQMVENELKRRRSHQGIKCTPAKK